jgi:ribosomal protein L40E
MGDLADAAHVPLQLRVRAARSVIAHSPKLDTDARMAVLAMALWPDRRPPDAAQLRQAFEQHVCRGCGAELPITLRLGQVYCSSKCYPHARLGTR